MARRSARLAKASTPALEPPSLASVAEREDAPPEKAPRSLDAVVSSPMVPKTPKGSSPLKPPVSEMHPSRAHQTMAPPSSGLRLGFTDIKPVSARDDKLPAAVQSTPSKIVPPSSDFTFSFARRANADLKLGPEAQRMMEELREQAQRIKADLAAKHEAEKAEEEENNGRKLARAKGKAGRFSAAHMAEFKKMDSIANHPSAFRAQLSKTSTPLKAGIKRSQSKANLDEPESVWSKQPTPASTFSKPKPLAFPDAPSVAKRARQHIDDDASSSRPISRDGSSLPRPKSAAVGAAVAQSKPTLGSLMTPTKSSLARSSGAKTPGHATLMKSPSKSTLSGIPRSATTNSIPTTAKEVGKVEKKEEKDAIPTPRVIKSPTSRLDKVKSLFQRTMASPARSKGAIPAPPMPGSKTPAPARAIKEALTAQAPMTTPRKLTKRVAFTPETKRAALAQNSPSPIKSGIPLSKSRRALGEVYYPTLESVIAKDSEEAAEDAVAYPDLSTKHPLPEPPVKESAKPASIVPAAAGTFTFRSDHTIKFHSASPSFGSSPGQSSVRSVRPSILPTEAMPGSFPSSIMMTSPKKENEAPRERTIFKAIPHGLSAKKRSRSSADDEEVSPNKENEVPQEKTVFKAFPHGMANKKRTRVSTDEEDAEIEAAERAAKKRRQETVPEGDALLAPRLLASGKKQLASPSKSFLGGTPSSMKKRGISLSRLNMLARPKMRK
ncbi:hypothetical protein OQA88_86 [Cercophora sp. LCS_1]